MVDYCVNGVTYGFVMENEDGLNEVGSEGA